MYTLDYWKDLSERAIATFAQVLVALAGTDAFGWLSLNWGDIFLASAFAGGLSIAKSLAAKGLNQPDSASVVDLRKDPRADEPTPVWTQS